MAQTIWKFPLQIEDECRITMPNGAKLLTVQMQGMVPCLWAVVNPDAAKCERILHVYGTGHPITRPDEPYVGSIQMYSGKFVFHIFDGGGNA